MNRELSGFENPEDQIKWLRFPLYLIGAVVMSQLIMYLDDALLMAYVFCPYISVQMWASDSKIKWSNNKRNFFVYVFTSVIFLFLATLFVLEVLSFEKSATHSVDNYLLNTAVELIADQNKT
jgi:hypothetical protein